MLLACTSRCRAVTDSCSRNLRDNLPVAFFVTLPRGLLPLALVSHFIEDPTPNAGFRETDTIGPMKKATQAPRTYRSLALHVVYWDSLWEGFILFIRTRIPCLYEDTLCLDITRGYGDHSPLTRPKVSWEGNDVRVRWVRV